MNCRHCHAHLHHIFIDLGFAPPSNAYLTADSLKKPEYYFPLRLFVCEYCWLVQTEDYAQADELFNSEYAYFSSVSQSWLQHAADYVQMITQRLQLNKNSQVIEIAANDGYLLKNFVASGIPCLGIEPTASTAAAAESLGIPIWRDFFGQALAKKLITEKLQADLIIGNNVYAHVPDINDFTIGLKTILKPRGVITLEFPHLMRLIEQTQFDTIYHEHYSYLSLYTVCQIFKNSGLRVWHVEELTTHGGSLRIYGCHAEDTRENNYSVDKLLVEEQKNGLQCLYTYTNFQSRVNHLKNDLLLFLIEQQRLGKTVAAYGAAAKGNTLLNFAGVKSDLLPCVFDAAQSKQGKFLPGSHIPILAPDILYEYRPDVILILPWNIKTEVMKQLSHVNQLGCQFVIAIPKLQTIT